MSKTALNQIAPADLVGRVRRRRVPLPLPRDTPFGPDGDFSYEGMVARYNADLANNFGNLLVAGARRSSAKKCDGIGPAPRPDSPLRRRRPPRSYAGAAAAWDAVPPSDARSTPPGG